MTTATNAQSKWFRVVNVLGLTFISFVLNCVAAIVMAFLFGYASALYDVPPPLDAIRNQNSQLIYFVVWSLSFLIFLACDLLPSYYFVRKRQYAEMAGILLGLAGVLGIVLLLASSLVLFILALCGHLGGPCNPIPLGVLLRFVV